MSSNTKTAAFFGATGGCASASLAAALRDGYHCTALARNPDKLRNLMISSHSIPPETLDNLLSIHAGNVNNASHVQNVLTKPGDERSMVDTVLFGVGAAPKFQASLFQPLIMDDLHVCESGMASILSALDTLSQQGVRGKPLVIAISTTGLSDRKRDVPLLLWPLYHWGLKTPHADKAKMEQLLFSDRGAHIRDYVIVKPTLLTGGARRGLNKVKAGWMWGVLDENHREADEAGPMLGYTIGRTDVGDWIFDKVIKSGGWEGRCISLTY